MEESGEFVKEIVGEGERAPGMYKGRVFGMWLEGGLFYFMSSDNERIQVFK